MVVTKPKIILEPEASFLDEFSLRRSGVLLSRLCRPDIPPFLHCPFVFLIFQILWFGHVDNHPALIFALHNSGLPARFSRSAQQAADFPAASEVDLRCVGKTSGRRWLQSSGLFCMGLGTPRSGNTKQAAWEKDPSFMSIFLLIFPEAYKDLHRSLG